MTGDCHVRSCKSGRVRLPPATYQTRTSGSAGGLGKRIGSNPGTAPQADPTFAGPCNFVISGNHTWFGPAAMSSGLDRKSENSVVAFAERGCQQHVVYPVGPAWLPDAHYHPRLLEDVARCPVRGWPDSVPVSRARIKSFRKGSDMGKSAWLARMVAVCAVTALAGSALAVAPANADTRGAPALSVATPAAVRGDVVTTRGEAVSTGLRITIAGVSPGGRASVRVTGPKQGSRAAKRYSKVIHRSTTLRVVPGVYRVTSRSVAATGGTDVPKVATQTLRVRKNRLTGFTVRYQFVTLCAASVVGDTGPGGGKIFYVDMTRPSGSQCFEAAPNTWSGGADPGAEWCSNMAASLVGTFGTAIGTGKTNTANMVAAVSPGPCSSGAGFMAYNYSNGAANSWFLPSQDELNQLCKYARGQSTTVADQDVVCNSSGSLQGGFIAVFYWSSSQSSAFNAWAQGFVSGDQGNGNKGGHILPVRPVRAY